MTTDAKQRMLYQNNRQTETFIEFVRDCISTVQTLGHIMGHLNGTRHIAKYF